MSTQPATSQRIAGPRWLVAGRIRRRLALARFLAMLTPAAVAWLAATIAAGVTLGRWGIPLVWAAAGATVTVPRRGRAWLARVYWHARWFWDARAAGLAVEAEPDILGKTDGPLDRRVLVVPPVKIRLTPAGREYRCRPLPGQLLGDYQAACARLAIRWGAVDVRVDYRIGGRHIVIGVAHQAPEVKEWTP